MYFINKEVTEYLARTIGGTDVGWCIFIDTVSILILSVTFLFLFRKRGGKDDN